jgi:hypothetical protein
MWPLIGDQAKERKVRAPKGSVVGNAHLRHATSTEGFPPEVLADPPIFLAGEPQRRVFATDLLAEGETRQSLRGARPNSSTRKSGPFIMGGG